MKYRILLIDDNKQLRTEMKKILSRSDLDLETIEAVDGAQALPHIMNKEVDIVLSDIVMPNLDGIALLRTVRKNFDQNTLPMILVTSQAEISTRNLSFEVGASDYLTRPFSSDELITRVKIQIRLLMLQQELKQANERHNTLTTLDELTGLSNRTHFLDLSRRELARSRRHNLNLTIAVIDIDSLQKVNERIGYRAGDAIITEMAELIQRQLRAADVLARFSGGTFSVLFPHTDLGQARIACQRIFDAVRSHAFADRDDGAITLSVGLSTYPYVQTESVDELINAAQSSLDKVKERGGNGVESSNQNLNT